MLFRSDRPAAKDAFRHAAAVAHANGRQVSLTLSDSFCVDRHRDDFRALVSDDVDILFGNEDELLSLYQVESFDAAVAAVRADCHLAVITMGKDGCVVVTKDEVVRAEVARRAARAGKPIVIVNIGETKADELATAKIEANTSLVLERLFID